MGSNPPKDVIGQKLAMTDIPTLRKRAREHIEKGAVTSGYAADREAVLKLFFPMGLAERSRAEYVGGATLEDMIKEDLIAENLKR